MLSCIMLINRLRLGVSAVIAVVLLLTGCSSGGSCSGCSASSSSLTLSLTAPNQYPAGVAVTAYLTLTNTSSVNATNLVYSIPSAYNQTGATITVSNDRSVNPCVDIAAGQSCTFSVDIAANPPSHPGSFRVDATPTASNSLANKAKSLVGIKAGTLSLTANIGLTDLPANTESGANGISFLYSPTITMSANGVTKITIVGVVNSATAGIFNTINLTDASGNLLNFKVLSSNSGSGLANLSQGSIVTFLLEIPAGVSSYDFYAQTMLNGSRVNQSTIANPINMVSSNQGILVVQPTNFNLNAAESYTSQVITYTNTGNAELTGLSIAPPGSAFSLSNNTCTTSLAPGASCTVTLEFNYQAAGSGSSSLIATYDQDKTTTSNFNYSGGSYIAPVVTVVMSSSESGSPVLSGDVSANTDFYIVYTLTGGYNESMTYGVTISGTPGSPAMTVVAPVTCTLTSLTPTCSIKISSGGQASNQSISYVPQGSAITPSPANSGSFNVTPPMWTMVGGSIIESAGSINSVIVVDSSNIYGGGEGTDGGAVWKYNGSSWSKLGGTYIPDASTINTIAMDNGILYAGGQGSSALSYNAGVWKYDGTSWSLLGGAVLPDNGRTINSILVKNGVVYAGGMIWQGGSTYIGGVWKYENNAWSLITGSSINQSFAVNSIALDSANNIIAGGTYVPSASTFQPGVWSGSPWSLVGGASISSDGSVNSITLDGNNDIYACGSSSSQGAAWKYSSASWGDIGAGAILPNSNLCKSIILNDGVIYAAGQVGAYPNQSGVVWKYNGTSWDMVGSAISEAYIVGSLVVNDNIIYVGGSIITTSPSTAAVWQYK